MTTETAGGRALDTAVPPPLITRPLLVRFVSVAGTATSFYLLLSTVPLYARSAGATAATAGLTTSALTLSAVAAYLVAPRLTARYGYRLTLAAGLLALGLPALVLAVSANIALIMAACVIRGLGFAVICVAGGALTVSLIPPGRRGEGLAVIGVVSGLPSVAALPLGVWLAGHVGYPSVFVAGGVAALAGLASLPWLPGPRPPAASPLDRPAGRPLDRPAASPLDRSAASPLVRPAASPLDRPAGRPLDRCAAEPADRCAAEPAGRCAAEPAGRPVAKPPDRPVDRAPDRPAAEPADRAAGVVAVLRNPALVRPAVTFSATTMAVGVIVTFLPLAVARPAADVAALALLVQPAASIGGRWLAGRYGDRRGSAALLGPGVIIAAAGLLALSLTAIPAAVIAGAAVFGLGFGVTQNASQTLMYDRVPERGYGAVSAVWNLAYDGGMGLGAAGFGVLVVHTGYPAAFALTAAVLPLVLVVAGRDRGGRRR
jgi:predicted MFS family arabinose efflux permease